MEPVPRKTPKRVARPPAPTEEPAPKPPAPRPAPEPPQEPPREAPPEPPTEASRETETPRAPASRPPGPSRRSPFAEARERSAQELAARGDLARALVQWKILALLEPENPRHRERAKETRRRVRELVGEHAVRAEEAWRRGDAAAAEEELLRALALDPLEAGAAQRLREMEVGKISSREVAKVSRGMGRPAAVAAAGPARSPSPAAASQAGYYLETGIELFRQGDYDGSVVELDKYLRSYPDDPRARKALAEARLKLGQRSLEAGDAAGAVRHFDEARKSGAGDARKIGESLQKARKKLAEEFYEKGVRASRTDLAKAIDYWKQCLANDPNHLGARAQLDKALRISEKLKGIP